MFLGIDIGTSGVKAVAMTADGVVAETATTALAISRPNENWSEQDPSDWWRATQDTILKLSAKTRSAIQGVGLSGQMHGATFLERDGRVLRPAILWNDGRSVTEGRDLQTRYPAFLEKTGNLVMPGFTAPKVEWVRRHEPDIFGKIDKVLLPKDYVRYRLCGDFASDMSDSAGTLWLDVGKRAWAEDLLAACGLNLSQMPRLYEGVEQTGQMRVDVAQSLGMKPTPIVAGGGDNAAGAVAVGAVDAGQSLLSLGTSGVIFTATETYRANPASAVHSFCHALPERWHLMSVILSAASCLEWGRRITGNQSVTEFIRPAETRAPTDTTPIFLPYLSGERTPHNNPHARGAFFGLSHDTGPAQIAQAIMEGVAFALADGVDALSAADAHIDALTVIGGGAQSAHWGRVLAAALGKRLIYRDGADVGPALGAARLAAYGVLGGDMADTFAPPPVLREIEPDPTLSNHYAEKRAQFAALYRTLNPLFDGASYA